MRLFTLLEVDFANVDLLREDKFQKSASPNRLGAYHLMLTSVSIVVVASLWSLMGSTIKFGVPIKEDTK